MKIQVLQPSGFCSGVALAIQKAKETRNQNPNDKIVVLGMLVHNQQALKELEECQIETYYDASIAYLDMIDKIPNGSIVILTAHGHSKAVEEKLNQRSLRFVDATCPFVTLSFDLIKKEIEEGHEVIYIGKKNHPESNAALSISNKVHLVELFKPLELSFLKDRSPLVLSQTTFSKKEIEILVNEIKEVVPNARFHNGVCHASTERQEAMLKLDKNVQLIYVVGGKKSNNTKTLFKMAEKNFINAAVFQIEDASEINKKDLLGLSYIAITSGTSTPKEVIEAVKSKLELLSN